MEYQAEICKSASDSGAESDQSYYYHRHYGAGTIYRVQISLLKASGNGQLWAALLFELLRIG